MGLINPEKIKEVLTEVVVLALAGTICIVSAYFIINKFFVPRMQNDQLKPIPISVDVVDETEGASETGKEDGKEKKLGVIYPLKTVIVNLAGENARRYVKVALSLELTEESVVDTLNEREPQVYDGLIRILGNYRLSEINSVVGKESLKEEIKDTINLFLDKTSVTNVYITEMIIQ